MMRLAPCRAPWRSLGLLGLSCVALLYWGCARGGGVGTLKGVEHFYGECERQLERHRYLEAVENCQRVVSNFPGSALVVDAQFHLAEAYFRMEDYVNAVFEYQRLVDSYPRSSWADRAQFQVGESYYRQSRRPELDQSESYEALAHFRRFLDDRPESPLVKEAEERIAACRDRLASKLYLSARLYEQQGHLEAARITYEELLQSYPDTGLYLKARAQLGSIAHRDGDADRARLHWSEVVDQTDDDELRRRVQAWLSELEGEGD